VRKSRAAILAAVAVLVAAAATTVAFGAATAAPIKIGAVLSLTGPGSSLGIEEDHALVLKVAQLNAGGGIKGHKVQLQIVDDQSRPDLAVQVTRTMLSDFNPKAIIGGSVSATCLAMKPVTEQAKIVQYCLSATPIPLPAPYFFGAQSPFTRWIGDVPVYWMVRQGIKSVGCLNTNDSSGQLTAQVVKKAATNAGIKFFSQSFSGTDTDVTPQLTKLRADNVEALYVCTTGAGVVTALQGIKQLGFNVPVWISSGSASLPIAGLIKGILPAQGAYTAGAKVQVVGNLPNTDRQRKLIVAFAAAYQKKFNEPADIFSATGADAFNILTRAIAGAGVNASSDAIVKYMEDKIRLTGVQLNYNFTPGDHRGTDLDGIVEKYTPQGGFQFVAVYKPGQIPRYAER
jgi:branched-chain amino acid transport system substrate-binding protein